MTKKRKQISPIEPDVLNTEFIYLALDDDFKRAAENAGWKTFQDILNDLDRALDGSVFTPSQEMEMFSYAEHHCFINLFGLE